MGRRASYYLHPFSFFLLSAFVSIRSTTACEDGEYLLGIYGNELHLGSKGNTDRVTSVPPTRNSKGNPPQDVPRRKQCTRLYSSFGC